METVFSTRETGILVWKTTYLSPTPLIRGRVSWFENLKPETAFQTLWPGGLLTYPPGASWKV
jgi:hypothetical protein